MEIDERCPDCDMPLVYRDGSVEYRFTAHDDEACRIELRYRVELLEKALKAQAESIQRRAEMELRRAREEGRAEGLREAAQEADAWLDYSGDGVEWNKAVRSIRDALRRLSGTPEQEEG